MMPWEKYAEAAPTQEEGPWTKYKKPESFADKRTRELAQAGLRRENAKQGEAIEPNEALEEPWIDPVSAASGGFGGALPGAIKQAGKIGVKALARPVASGMAGAAADYPIGAATEHIGEKYPKAALPFNVIAGMASGMTFERMAEEVLRNPKNVLEWAKTLSKQELGEIFGNHGSHALFGKFDSGKIGTGEGSQVFGWGAYVTDNPEIGKTYAVMKNGKNGYLYDVTIHKGKKPEEYDYISWHDNINEKQKRKLASALSKNGLKIQTPSLRGEDVYNALAYSFADKHKMALSSIGAPNSSAQKMASQMLKNAGIDGIEYKSGTLSGKDAGSKNYVVFSPDDIFVNDVKKVTQE